MRLARQISQTRVNALFDYLLELAASDLDEFKNYTGDIA